MRYRFNPDRHDLEQLAATGDADAAFKLYHFYTTSGELDAQAQELPSYQVILESPRIKPVFLLITPYADYWSPRRDIPNVMVPCASVEVDEEKCHSESRKIMLDYDLSIEERTDLASNIGELNIDGRVYRLDSGNRETHFIKVQETRDPAQWSAPIFISLLNHVPGYSSEINRSDARVFHAELSSLLEKLEKDNPEAFRLGAKIKTKRRLLELHQEYKMLEAQFKRAEDKIVKLIIDREQF